MSLHLLIVSIKDCDTIDVVTATVTPIPAHTMVPPATALPDVLPTDRINAKGVMRRPWRDELRRIPTARNVVTVAGCVLQTYGVVVAAAVIDRWWAWLLAFALMGRGHALLNILAHEAAHRLLFPNRVANDFVGRWVLGYPTLQPFTSYRRAHFAHHRDEMGPAEPDLALYRGYPVRRTPGTASCVVTSPERAPSRTSRGLVRAIRKGSRRACDVAACRLVLLGSSIARHRPLLYVVWIGSWATLWKFSNRLRAIAEHGGMERSADRRRTTHVIRQSRLARFFMVPYHTGWHLAHHADMGVPWRNLPRLHDELVASGWLTPDIEYPSLPGVLEGVFGRLTR